MRNFAILLLIFFPLFSCRKENDNPENSTGNTPQVPPATQAASATKVTIMINDTLMNITSLTYNRYGDGSGGGMIITANNATQQVTADVFNFYQQGPFDMMYEQEVSYFTRADSLSAWSGNYTRPVPRDDQVTFVNFTPLKDSVVTGGFSASFSGAGGVVKEGQAINVTGNFKLVFIK